MSIQMSTNFAHDVVSQIFSKVKGHSTLAKLSGQTPIAFSGSDIFVFSLDDEANIVAEKGQKTEGRAKAEPVKIVPIKVEYGSRVTDEFMYASEEKQLDILGSFTDGYSKKIGRAIDLMAFHGMNPRTKQLSTAIIGTNSFDTNTDIASITYTAGSELANLEAAVAAIGDADLTGYALSKNFAGKLALATVGNMAPFYGFMLGGNPGVLNGINADVNSTVSAGTTGDGATEGKAQAYVGDFQNAFKWGFAKNIPVEVIPYGDPDGNGDLKRSNEVFLRAEAWIGWGILDPSAFSRIAAA